MTGEKTSAVTPVDIDRIRAGVLGQPKRKRWCWYWHLVYGVVLVIDRQDTREPLCVCADRVALGGMMCEPKSVELIGPIAGPGRPPRGPTDRADAERMARELAANTPRACALLCVGAASTAVREHGPESLEPLLRALEFHVAKLFRSGELTLPAAADALGLDQADAEQVLERCGVEAAKRRARTDASVASVEASLRQVREAHAQLTDDAARWKRRAEESAGALEDLAQHRALERGLCCILGLPADEAGPADIERAVARFKADAAKLDVQTNIANKLQHDLAKARGTIEQAKRANAEALELIRLKTKRTNEALAERDATRSELEGAREALRALGRWLPLPWEFAPKTGQTHAADGAVVAIAEHENDEVEAEELARLINREVARAQQAAKSRRAMADNPRVNAHDVLFETLSQAALPDAAEITEAIVNVARDEVRRQIEVEQLAAEAKPQRDISVRVDGRGGITVGGAS